MKRTTIETLDESSEDLAGMPLFQSAESGEAAYVLVMRDDPEEGVVGRVPPAATESDIGRKYGGGTFSLSLRNQSGKPIKGGHRTIQIAGDPIFRSKAAEQKWKHQNGLDESPQRGEKPLGLGEIMLLMEKQSEKARADAQQMFLMMNQVMQAAHTQQIQSMKEDNNRRESAEREERDRNREFLRAMTEMRATPAPAADPVGLLMAGVKLARELGGNGEGDPADPLQTLAANLPGILGEARRMMTPAAPPPPQLAAPEAPKPDDVTLQGDLAAKARATVARLQAQGKDPAQVLGRAFEVLGQPRSLPPVADPEKQVELRRHVPRKVLRPKSGDIAEHRESGTDGGSHQPPSPEAAISESA